MSGKKWLTEFVAIAFTTGCLMSAQGAVPMQKTQPGFYRMMLGDFEITALNDGVVYYQTKRALPNETPEQIKSALFAAGLTDPVGMSYNAFLVNTGSKLVLIDTGTGGKWDDKPEFHGVGHVMANLRAAGYQPEQVDEIYITHIGLDHIGGATIGTARAFPNALLRASRAEVDFFLDPVKAASTLAKTPDKERADAKAYLEFLRSLFEPYIKAGKFQSFDEDITLAPGVRALATHGHTPGHTSYVVESKGQTLIVMGDLVHIGAMQFADPALSSAFDTDPSEAATQRRRVLQIAADHDDWIAGAHLSFPGIGHVRFEQSRYGWAPANYTIP